MVLDGEFVKKYAIKRPEIVGREEGGGDSKRGLIKQSQSANCLEAKKGKFSAKSE